MNSPCGEQLACMLLSFRPAVVQNIKSRSTAILAHVLFCAYIIDLDLLTEHFFFRNPQTAQLVPASKYRGIKRCEWNLVSSTSQGHGNEFHKQNNFLEVFVLKHPHLVCIVLRNSFISMIIGLLRPSLYLYHLRIAFIYNRNCEAS